MQRREMNTRSWEEFLIWLDWKEPRKPHSKTHPGQNERNSALSFSKYREQEESSGASVRTVENCMEARGIVATLSLTSCQQQVCLKNPWRLSALRGRACQVIRGLETKITKVPRGGSRLHERYWGEGRTFFREGSHCSSSLPKHRPPYFIRWGGVLSPPACPRPHALLGHTPSQRSLSGERPFGETNQYNCRRNTFQLPTPITVWKGDRRMSDVCGKPTMEREIPRLTKGTADLGGGRDDLGNRREVKSNKTTKRDVHSLKR